MKVKKIKEFNEKNNSVSNGDVCESCDTKEKPIYHLENQSFGIDIILCPKCIDTLKNNVDNIQV